MNLSRRKFLGAASAWALPLFLPRELFAQGPSIRLGFLGVGRRGQQLLEELPRGAKAVAVSDAFSPRADAVGERYRARSFNNYRDVIDRRDVDAVVIATPDHWHALIAVSACQAGKDVYCEKPLSLTVREGRTMVNAARKYRRVFQVGTQQRSLLANRVACSLLRSGAMGRIQRVVVARNWSPTDERLPGEGMPEGMEWDNWLGPAPGDIAYNNGYPFPENEPGWSSRRFFCGGECCGWGAHGYDQLQWALGMDNSGPVAVQADGPEGDSTVRWWYANGVEVEMGDAPKPGGHFFCERGQLNIDRNRFNIMPEDMKRRLLRLDVPETPENSHMQNFLDCVRSRRTPNADVEIGHRSVTVAHLANIARGHAGRRLEWDPVMERFTNDEAANGCLSRPRRADFEMPEV